MFEKLVFIPDPRTYKSKTIGIDDTESRLRRISIQLGSKSGKWVKDGGQSAVLERGNDGFYSLFLQDLEKGRYESYKVFDDTKDPKEVCRKVENMFEQGELIAYQTKGRKKPILRTHSE